MMVYIEKEEQTKKMKFKGTVNELLGKLKINPVTVVVADEKRLLTSDEKLSDDSSIRILSVISGG